MRILVVGGGGREHALAWRIRKDLPGAQLFAAPGNPGIGALAMCIPLRANDVDALTRWSLDEGVDLVVVGPEVPLAAGLVDRLRSAGVAAFGPTAAAAEIETSKAFAKELMLAAGVPTARAIICSDSDAARAAARELGAPVVVKASGLAAGKGVIVAPTIADADAAIAAMLDDGAFGAAGETVLVEEFMDGEELSLFVITDGTRAEALPAAQDHKRLLDGDRGPNTGGMGAYAPVSLAARRLADGRTVVQAAMESVVEPTLAAMRKAGRPFTGLLYAGLMITRDGPKVVEFNCRFGDPETQAVLPILQCEPSLTALMLAVGRGEPLPDATVRATGFALTTVVAAAGYPDTPRTGDPLILPEVPDDVLVFHAGTRRDEAGALLSSGGRVLAVTGTGATLEEARARSAGYAGRVALAGRHFRADIGWRDLTRGAGAS